MKKEMFIQKATDKIKQEKQIIKCLNLLKEVVKSFDGKVYNKRLINKVNDVIRMNDLNRCGFNKSEYNDNDIYVFVHQMGNVSHNRIYLKVKTDSNNRIKLTETIEEIEKTIESRNKDIEEIKNDCVLFDTELIDRKKILDLMEEYRKKYSYRLAVHFTYNTNRYF